MFFQKAEEIFAGIANAIDKKLSYSSRLKTGKLNRKQYSNCYAEGNVSGETGSEYLGGLTGDNEGNISNCYARGIVTGAVGSGFLGGLVRRDSEGSYTSSFWNSDVNPDVNGIGNASDPNVIGKTTTEMQTETTFTDPAANWDFLWESTNGDEDIWVICEGVDYPKLIWQFTMGDFDDDDDLDFMDFALFSIHWLGSDDTIVCGGVDLTGEGNIDYEDLKKFIDNWLEGVE